MSAKLRMATLATGIALSTITSAIAEDAPAGNAAAPSVDVFGRVLFDYVYADGKNTAFSVDETELRAARIGAEVKLTNGTKFKAALHTDDSGDVVLKDVYVEFDPGFDIAKIRIGQFKTPNSLDEATSSKFTAAHERAAFTDAFELDRRVGVALTGKTDRHTYMLGVFGQNIDDDMTFGGYAVAGRATYSPDIGATDTKLHTGASFRYREHREGQSDFRYRQRPTAHIPGRIISTGPIAASDVFAGVEAALLRGSIWTSGEYAVTHADCAACADDPTLWGGYVEAGLMLNGKRTLKDGKFGRPQIGEGRLGAASLTLRYDTLDLNSTAVDGGSYRAVILGADWWPNKYWRLGVNGYFAKADLGAVTSGLDPLFADAVTSGLPQETVRGVALRAQFDFRSGLFRSRL